jgi:hypothetical protein
VRILKDLAIYPYYNILTETKGLTKTPCKCVPRHGGSGIQTPDILRLRKKALIQCPKRIIVEYPAGLASFVSGRLFEELIQVCNAG